METPKIYLDNCCYNRPFDYTEWRRGLWNVMTIEEIFAEAATHHEASNYAQERTP